MLNESDRERQIPSDFMYMWNLKNKTETVIETEKSGGCQQEEGRGEKLVREIKKYELPVSK